MRRAKGSVAKARAQATILWRTAAVVVGACSLAAAGTLTPIASVSAAPSPEARYVVVLEDTITGVAAVVARHGQRLGFRPEHMYSHALTGYVASMSRAAAEELRADPAVEM